MSIDIRILQNISNKLDNPRKRKRYNVEEELIIKELTFNSIENIHEMLIHKNINQSNLTAFLNNLETIYKQSRTILLKDLKNKTNKETVILLHLCMSI